MTDTTKRRILEATLAIVGEGGFPGLTVRAIAERAGTSVSAVSYHFGGKDEAVAEAFHAVTEDFEAAFELLRTDGRPAKVRLEAFVASFVEAIHAHGSAMAFFIGRLNQGMKAPASYKSFVSKEGLALVVRVMKEIAPGIKPKEASMRLSLLAGGMLYPELVPGALDLDFENRATRKEYARLACASFMAGLD